MTSAPVRAPVAARPTVRLVAVDVARTLAIVGMVVVNVGPRDGDGPAGWVLRAAHGRASVLFVLLAGLGVGLMLASPRRGVATLVVRGVVLLAAGLALQLLDHDVSVVLPTYAALFVVAAGAHLLSRRALLAAALAVTVLGPVGWLLAQRGGEFAMTPPTLTAAPLEVLGAVVLTGPYPLITWAAPFLLGMWLARHDLTDRRNQRRLLVVGLVATVAALAISAATGADGADRTDLARLASSVAHSQTPVWLVGSMGSCLAVLAAVLLLAPRLGRLTTPLAALGRMSLTAYVAHLVVIALLVRPGPGTAAAGLAVSAAFTIAALAVATAWQRWLRTGPAEMVLRAPERLLPRRRFVPEPAASPTR